MIVKAPQQTSAPLACGPHANWSPAVIWVKVSLGGEDSPDETRDAARIALAGGYRHIDTAAAYGNGGCGRTFLG